MSELESLLRRATEQLDIAGYRCYVVDADETKGGQPVITLTIWEDEL